MKDELAPIVDFPLKAPDDRCNHRLARGTAKQYCSNGAGQGTEHVGYGRCKAHENGADGDSVELFRSLGLGDMIAIAEMMSQDDQEYAMHVSNNFLVLQRAKTIRAMDSEHISSKERKELIDTVARIDFVLKAFPIEVREDGSQVSAQDNEEMGRLLDIKKRAKKQA